MALDEVALRRRRTDKFPAISMFSIRLKHAMWTICHASSNPDMRSVMSLTSLRSSRIVLVLFASDDPEDCGKPGNIVLSTH